jgi:thioredoxin-dependent adenylylsulfate APS reductase
MAASITPKVRVFSLDTGRLPQETYDLMDRVRNRYGIKIETLFPDAAEVEKMVTNHGINLFYDSVEKRRLCCGVRKVKPLRRILSSLDAWVVGLRRDQNVTRTEIRKVGIDHANYGIVKLSPLADWSGEQVWDYVRENKVPYNALHDRGFPSIGCEPCSRSVEAGEDPRSGRWWWENSETKECGLHPKS